MNIEKLVAAAKKIDALSNKQKALVKDWQVLASDARRPDADLEEIRRRRDALDGSRVVDFGTAIDELSCALKARPTKGKSQAK